MTVLVGPCMSFSAHGTLGNEITYAQKGRTCYSKEYFTPSNPQSDEQTATRFFAKWIAQQWATLNQDQQQSWKTLAKRQHMSNYHAFIKHGMNRWKNGLLPAKDLTNTAKPSYTTCPFFWTWQDPMWHMVLKPYYLPDDPWCAQLFVSSAPDFTPDKTHTIDLYTDWTKTTSAHLWTEDWTPPNEQTYYARTRFCMNSGISTPILTPW